jgi:uncharacterized membrane protein YdfJ with MMPL/SSD domain
MSSARRLTGAAGRRSAGHPCTAIAAWLGAVVVLVVAGHLAGTVMKLLGPRNWYLPRWLGWLPPISDPPPPSGPPPARKPPVTTAGH